MKRTFLILIILLSIGLNYTSCGKKQSVQNDEKTEKETVFEVKNAVFNDNWNVAYDLKKNISKEKFDSLRLNTLSFLPPYGDLDIQIGNVLLNTNNKKLLSIKAIASGEISEYLLGYINNNITDSLLVAYEDNVEYYSTTSSIISNNKITVTTIDWDYSGTEEVSDTTITIYNIRPNLTFDEIVE